MSFVSEKFDLNLPWAAVSISLNYKSLATFLGNVLVPQIFMVKIPKEDINLTSYNETNFSFIFLTNTLIIRGFGMCSVFAETRVNTRRLLTY